LLGKTGNELDGSVWADVIHQHLGGLPPRPDLAAEKALAGLMVVAARDGLVTSAHDVSAGGLFATLTEAVLRRMVGARIWLSEVLETNDIDLTAALFSESVARMVVTVAREDDVKFRGLCAGRGVPVSRIGVTELPSRSLDIAEVFSFSLEELDSAIRGTLPQVLGPVVGYHHAQS
jgi:phosphoribosylformylglycinamidine synthase